MPEPTFREATLDDIRQLRRLEQGIIEAERPFDPALKKGSTIYYDLAGLIEDVGSHLLVVEAGLELVGSGYVLIRESMECFEHQQHAYLGFIYVDSRYRGNGIAREIMDRLIAWGKSKGVSNFQLQVYAENKSAIRAYEKSGFVTMAVRMELEL